MKVFKIILSIIFVSSLLINGTGQSYALRPMATDIEKKIPHIKWINGVEEVIDKPQGDKQIRLSGENLGRLTAVKKAEYKGKTYYAKFILVEKITENTTEGNLITPQPEILQYLNSLGIKGIPKVEYSLEIKFRDGHQGKAILFKKFPKGESLLYNIFRMNEIPEKEAVDIALKVLGIVRQLHSAGVYHYDITPSNIRIAKGNEPLLFDFDTAFRTKEEFLSRHLYVFCNEYYASYSRYHIYTNATAGIDVENCGFFPSPADDLYSVAMVLLHMLVGPSYPKAIDPRNYSNSQLARLKKESPITPELIDILSKALADGKCDYKTADEFIAALENYRAHKKTEKSAITKDSDTFSLENYEPVIKSLIAEHFSSLPYNTRVELKQAARVGIWETLEMIRLDMAEVLDLTTRLRQMAYFSMINRLKKISERKPNLNLDQLIAELSKRENYDSVLSSIGQAADKSLAQLKGLEKALAETSEVESQAWKLRKIEGLSLKEASRILEIIPSAVSFAVSRAEAKMKKYFAKHGIKVGPLFGMLKTKMVETRRLALLRYLEEAGPMTVPEIGLRMDYYHGMSQYVVKYDLDFLLRLKLVGNAKTANEFYITSLGKQTAKEDEISKPRKFKEKEQRWQWILTNIREGLNTKPGLMDKAVEERNSVEVGVLTSDLRFFASNKLVTRIGKRKGREGIKWGLANRGELYLTKLVELSGLDKNTDTGLRDIRLSSKAVGLLEVMKDCKGYTTDDLLRLSAYKGNQLWRPIAKLTKLGLAFCAKESKSFGHGGGSSPAIYHISKEGLDWLDYNDKRKNILESLDNIKNGLDDKVMSDFYLDNLQSGVDIAMRGAA